MASLRALRKARDRIDRDYADRIDIPALAAGAGYSREHFIRAFRSAYGETPGRYRPGLPGWTHHFLRSPGSAARS